MLFLKRRKCSIVFIFLLFNGFNYVVSEIITLSAIGAAAFAGAWFKWDEPIKDYTICRFMECCNDAHVPYDLDSELCY